MKYVEELNSGDCFIHNNLYYLLTTDFKKNGNKLAYSLLSGTPLWLDSKEIVNLSPVYTLDNENNIIPIKETPKDESLN